MSTETITIESLTDQALMCRTLGHSWDENKNPEIATYYPKQWLMALRCVRCRTERFDWIDRAGVVISRSYRYSNRYKTIKGARRGNFRAEMLSRSLLVRRYTNGKG